MLTQTVTVSRTGALILARLLTPPARLSPASLRKNLEPFFRGRDPGTWQAFFDETLADLERDGLVARKPLALTDAGRARALEFLGLEALPPRTDWKRLKDRYLTAAALGIETADPEQRKRIAAADGLRAAILQLHYNLPAVKGLTQALDALVWKELGFDGTTAPLKNPSTLRDKVLSQVLEMAGGFDFKKFKNQLPAHAVGASRSGADELRTALLREWLKDSAPADAVVPADLAAQEASPPFDLAGFAAQVQAAAQAGETGRFGDNKVFISHVWRKLRAEEGFPDLTEAEFKRRLTEANHQGLLHLSRADLVEVMDPADVQASETPYLHAVFHFVQV